MLTLLTLRTRTVVFISRAAARTGVLSWLPTAAALRCPPPPFTLPHRPPLPSFSRQRRYYGASTTTAANEHGSRSLISLQADGTVTNEGEEYDEVTVYIKGFLSQNESSEEFSEWTQAHRRLQHSAAHSTATTTATASPSAITAYGKRKDPTSPTPTSDVWGPVAMGYTWASGHHADALSAIAFPFKGLWNNSKLALLPLPTITMTYTLLKYARRAGSLTPAGLATAASVELAHTVGWQAYKLHSQYKDVHKNIDGEARALAAEIDGLCSKYKKVRIVGLSLGGLLALEAQTIRATRPLLGEGGRDTDGTGGSVVGQCAGDGGGGDAGGTVELHLCGAAVTLSRAMQLLSAVQASTPVTVYHATTDTVLSVFFSFAEGEPSIGEVGVPDEVLERMPNVACVDASGCLETLVHWDYSNKFDRLVRMPSRRKPSSP